ncbi:hypothetical protein GUJ93_ZPchr0012g21196 [Zizania palustris]|uniref:Retrotransposon Copia-like N-terminal domain-containing protein n=1 Tax=Zizania palustris TaxID=103762 RepID=A0A8J5WPB3_ZIZPA|nr:hypothetical protein GUJ93_ZPchr0012g21196 [Zizania palustris]
MCAQWLGLPCAKLFLLLCRCTVAFATRSICAARANRCSVCLFYSSALHSRASVLVICCRYCSSILFAFVMSRSSAIAIPIKLDGHNYREWAFSMKTALRGYALASHLTDAPPIDKLTDGSGAVEVKT